VYVCVLVEWIIHWDRVPSVGTLYLCIFNVDSAFLVRGGWRNTHLELFSLLLQVPP
jgi:hypothetical protein